MKLAILDGNNSAASYLHAVKRAKGVDFAGTSVAGIDGLGTLTRGGYDTVLCCAPAAQRPALLARIADAGFSAITHLPFAADTKEASALYERFERANCRLIPYPEGIYHGNQRDVKKKIEAGALGDIGAVDFWRSARCGGSAVWELILQDAVTAVWWLGGVDEFFGQNVCRDGTGCAMLTVKMKSGALISLGVGCGMGNDAFYTYELSGSLGNLSFDSRSALSVRFEGGDCKMETPPQCGAAAEPFRLFLEEAAQTGGPPRRLVIDAYRLAEFCVGGTTNYGNE